MKFDYYKPKESDFFDLAKGKTIRVFTKFLHGSECFVYAGILEKKGKDFIYLRDGKVFKVEDEKEKEIKSFQRVALSKTIISFVEF